MSERSSRLFQIIQILRATRRPLPAYSLAETLEVSVRTVYRDIVTLQAAGVPIEGAAGFGYVMRAGYDLPPLMFTVDEVEAIIVGLALLGRTGDTDIQASAARVRGKIADVLPADAARLMRKTPLLVSSWNAVPPSAVNYHVIRQAIREEEKLLLVYADAHSIQSRRTVWPVALIYYVDTAVLAAWCELRNDFRHFRIDRIDESRQSGEYFTGKGAVLYAQWYDQNAPLQPQEHKATGQASGITG